MSKPAEDTDGLWLVYDGDCPLCRASAQAVRVRRAVGKLQAIDARHEHDHPLMERIAHEGLDLDQGIVVCYQDRLHHGADALHLLAVLGTDSDAFNRLSVWVFRSPYRTRLLYPLLKAGRRISLFVQGKSGL